jgi:hypothetical protein
MQLHRLHGLSRVMIGCPIYFSRKNRKFCVSNTASSNRLDLNARKKTYSGMTLRYLSL